MTKKDYILIASVIKKYHIAEATGVSYNISEGIADILQQDNSKFDKVRFLKACSIVDKIK